MDCGGGGSMTTGMYFPNEYFGLPFVPIPTMMGMGSYENAEHPPGPAPGQLIMVHDGRGGYIPYVPLRQIEPSFLCCSPVSQESLGSPTNVNPTHSVMISPPEPAPGQLIVVHDGVPLSQIEPSFICCSPVSHESLGSPIMISPQHPPELAPGQLIMVHDGVPLRRIEPSFLGCSPVSEGSLVGSPNVNLSHPVMISPPEDTVKYNGTPKQGYGNQGTGARAHTTGPGNMYRWNHYRQLSRKDRNSVCAFCLKNGEKRSTYENHSLREWGTKKITCPILQKYVCPICNATGELAHTVSHCPQYNAADNPNGRGYIHSPRRNARGIIGHYKQLY